ANASPPHGFRASRLTSLLQRRDPLWWGSPAPDDPHPDVERSTKPQPATATRRPVRVLRRVGHGRPTAVSAAKDGRPNRVAIPGQDGAPTRKHRTTRPWLLLCNPP